MKPRSTRLGLLLLVLGSAACGGGGGPSPSPDAEAAADVDRTPDAGPGMDALPAPDAAPEDSGGGGDLDAAMSNQPPVVSIAPVADVTLPALANLDGTVTDDGLPIGGSLTIQWVSLNGPGLVTFGDASQADTTASFSVSGDYMLGLNANDGAVMSSATVVVHVLDAAAPSNIIGQIGARSVEVGSTLTIELKKAGALTSTTVLFDAQPLPLEAGMSLVRTTGVFKFAPSPSQVGPHLVTFSGTNAAGTDREQITITVVGPQPGAPTALSGRILNANDAAMGIITPIEGVTIRSLDQPLAVTSGATGYFTLSGLNPGENYIEFDGSTVPGQRIAGYRARYNLPAGINTVIDRPIYLMRIEVAFEVPVNPSITTVINNTRIGVSLTIPPFTAKADDGSDYTGMISISEVPAMFTPGAGPPDLQPGMVVTVQPMGITFLNPAPVTFPNLDGLPSGSLMQVWSLNHRTGRFFIAGTSTVSPSGAAVGSITGGLREASWHFVLPPRPTAKKPRNELAQRECIPCRFKNALTSVSPHDGSVQIEHRMPGGSMLGTDFGLSLVFDSRRACPKPVVESASTIPIRSAVPPLQSSQLEVAGMDMGRPLFTDTHALSEAVDNTTRQSFRVDGRQFPTGAYPYQMRTTNHFGAQAVSAFQDGTVIINNGMTSPFGAGWSFAGWSQIYPSIGAGTLLVDGRGQALVFGDPFRRATALSNLRSEVPSTNQNAHMIRAGDFDQDGRVDFLSISGSEGMLGRQLVVYRNTGTNFVETYRVAVNGAYGGSPVVLADLNGDEALDVVYGSGVGRTGFGIPQLDVFFGLGNGRFRPAISYTPSGHYTDLAVGDLNEDGVPDIVWSKVNGGADVFLNSASGESLRPGVPIPGVAKSIELADIDRDGKLDLLDLVGNGNRRVYMRRGAGDGTFGAVAELAQLDGPQRLEVADLDGNGYVDLISYGSTGPSAQLSIALGHDGGFSAAQSTALGSFNIEERALTVRDIDGDGILDVTLAESSPARIHVAIGDGSGRFPDVTFVNFPVPVAAGPFVSAPVEVAPAPSGQPSSATLGIVHSFGGAREVSFLDLSIATTLSYRSPPGELSTLFKNPDGTYIRSFQGGAHTDYDANGRLTRQVDDRGLAISWSWDAQDRPTALVDSDNRQVSFHWGPSGVDIVDPANRTTALALDPSGNLVSITDPDGAAHRFGYDANHLVTTETSKNGDVSTNTYDRSCQATSVGNFQSSPTIVRPRTAGLGANLDDVSGTRTNPLPADVSGADRATITNGLGVDLSLKLDFNDLPTNIDLDTTHVRLGRGGDGQVTAETDPLNVTSTFRYGPELDVLSKTEGVGTPSERTTDVTMTGPCISGLRFSEGNSWGLSSNSSCDFTGMTDAQGHTITATYDPERRLSRVDVSGAGFTSIGYDAFDRPVSFVDATNIQTTVSWSSADNATAIIRAPGTPAEDRLDITYDSMNRPTSINATASGLTQYEYDANGNTVRTVFPDGRTILRSYDAADQVTMIDDSAKGAQSFAYDAAGNLVDEMDESGETTHYEYDRRGEVVAVSTSRGRETYGRDAAGQLTSFTDTNGLTTNFSYDPLGRLTIRADTLGRQRIYGWDRADRLISLRNERGQTITNTYDASGRLTARTGPSGSESFGYDLAGRMLFAQDADSRFELTYDNEGRILTQRTVDLGSQTAVTLTSSYDAAGRRVGMSDSSGGSIVWSYDAAGELIGVTTPGGGQIGLSSMGGRPSTLTCPSGVVQRYSYGPHIGPSNIHVETGAGATIEDLSYVRSASGRVSSRTDSSGTYNFSYDAAGRLLLAGTAALPESYTYDGANRRLSSHRSASHTYDLGSRLIADATYTYVHDMTRNRTSRRQTLGGQTLTYSYDAQNQLTAITGPGVNVAYRYDALGRVIEKRVGGTPVRRYIWDGANVVMTFTGANVLEARYVHGLDLDRPLALEAGGQTYCFHADELGSVFALTNAAGTAVNRYAYDAYGNMTTRVEGVPNLFTFVGREWDPDAGLYQMRTRFYDPNTGTFLQADSFGFLGGNVYEFGYANSDPVNQTDPWGRGGPEPDPRITPRDMRTTVLQQVYRGAQEAGLNIVGKTAVEVIEQDGLPPRLRLTVRLDENGQPLNRLEDAKRDGGKVAASTLVIEVNASWGVDGYYWNANSRVIDNNRGRYTAAAGCGPTKEEWRRARAGRPDVVALNDPETVREISALYPTEVNDSVRTSIGRLKSQDWRVRQPAPSPRWNQSRPSRSRGR